MAYSDSPDRLKDELSAIAPGRSAPVILTFEDDPLALFAVKGRRDGPAVFVEAALHGDECDGSIAITRLIRLLPECLAEGCVILCPVANPTAFAAGRASSPHDGKNLNRMGLDQSQTYSSRYFRYLADLISGNADVFIDLHGGGAYLDVLSFALVPAESDTGRQRSGELIRGLDLDCVAEAADRGELINEMSRRGLAAVLLENGGGTAIIGECVDRHFGNTLRILQNLGMLSAVPEEGCEGSAVITGSDSLKQPVSIRHEYDFYFENDGLVTTKAPVGSCLKKGDVVYGVTDLRTMKESLFLCPFEKAYLLSVHNTARARSGAYAAYLGTEE